MSSERAANALRSSVYPYTNDKQSDLGRSTYTVHKEPNGTIIGSITINKTSINAGGDSLDYELRSHSSTSGRRHRSMTQKRHNR